MSIETIIPKVITDRPSDPAAAVRAASTFSGAPLVQATVIPSGSGLSRTITVQVVNQKLQECRGLFMIAMVIGNAADGAPAGTTTIGTPTQGVHVATLVANQAAIFFTNASGTLVVQLTQSGSWTPRYPRVIVLGSAQGTEAVA